MLPVLGVLLGFVVSIIAVLIFKLLEATDPMIFVILAPAVAWIAIILAEMASAFVNKNEACHKLYLTSLIGCVITGILTALAIYV